MRDAWYAAMLLTVLLGVLLACGGVRYLRRLRAVRGLCERPTLAAAHLPEPGDALTKETYALIHALDGAYAAEKQAYASARREQAEYYTLWVHQVKTPIAAMRLLLENADVPEKGALQRELFSVEQYADMALRYAKLDDPAADLIPEPCDVGDCVREAVKKFAVAFVYRRLYADVQPMSLTVVTDRRWFLFVLEQILSNAVKYTVHGGVTVSLDGSVLTVRDTGVGIRAEDLPRVFDKGFTGLNGRLDTRASGIGLYLTKRVCGLLGISVSIDSVFGEGATVRLTLPTARAEAE